MEQVVDDLGLGALNSDFSLAHGIHVHRNNLEPFTALRAQLLEEGPHLLPAATTADPEHFLAVQFEYTVRIKADGTPQQFRAVHNWVMATSPNYWNIANPVRMKPEPVIERNGSKGVRASEEPDCLLRFICTAFVLSVPTGVARSSRAGTGSAHRAYPSTALPEGHA